MFFSSSTYPLPSPHPTSPSVLFCTLNSLYCYHPSMCVQVLSCARMCVCGYAPVYAYMFTCLVPMIQGVSMIISNYIILSSFFTVHCGSVGLVLSSQLFLLSVDDNFYDMLYGV